MTAKSARDRCLTRLSKICLALPEAVREDKGRHAAFLVRKRVFAYYLNDHHGDGIVSVACKTFIGDNVALAAAHPVALRLDSGSVDWEEAADVVKGSYLQIAPRALAARVKIESD